MKNTGHKQPEYSLKWYTERIDYLSEFMLADRAETIRRVLNRRTRYMTICTENMFHPQNASALVRHCDAFGVQDMHAVEELCRFKPNANIVKGTDKWVTINKFALTAEAIDGLHEKGYRIIATTPHAGDSTPESFDVEAGRFALFFGTEHEGISQQVMESADGFLRVPMEGFVDSLNVSASAAIALYILSSRVRNEVQGWQLSELEHAELLFDWMTRTVRESGKVLARFSAQEV